MSRCHSPLSFALAVVAIGIPSYWYLSESQTPAMTDREAMIGTWTDETGAPGNSIRFYFVGREIPGAPYATGYEGHLTVTGWLGEKHVEAIWNYGTWDPLVLNLLVGKKQWFAVVAKIDEDHILMRIGSDAEEMMRPDAIHHAETKRLTRIGREAAR